MTIGGRGGGGGGTRGGGGADGGGDVGTPGGGISGGCGCCVSGWTQADKSKNRNSSALACGVDGLVLHPDGNGLPGSESSPPIAPLPIDC